MCSLLSIYLSSNTPPLTYSMSLTELLDMIVCINVSTYENPGKTSGMCRDRHLHIFIFDRIHIEVIIIQLFLQTRED